MTIPVFPASSPYAMLHKWAIQSYAFPGCIFWKNGHLLAFSCPSRQLILLVKNRHMRDGNAITIPHLNWHIYLALSMCRL